MAVTVDDPPGAVPGTGQAVGELKDLQKINGSILRYGPGNGCRVEIGAGATGSNVLHKVDPVMVGPRFTTVPVRFVIGTDGRVKHIHVINAFPVQAKSVEDALRQWVLKP